MYYYFSSSSPSAIKLNGIYIGIISSAHKHVNVMSDDTLVELCPLNIKDSPLSFILNNDFLSNPPKNVSVVDMKGGYFITFSPQETEMSFGVLAQKKFDDCLLTALNDGTLKISVETPRDFYTFSPSENVLEVDFQKLSDNFICEIATLTNGEKTIYVFNVYDKIELTFTASANDILVSDKIILTERKKDIAKHVITTVFSVQNDKLIKTDFSIERKEGFSIAKLNEKILPYAFLEEFLAGGDYIEYLSENVKQNANKLDLYLGDFVGVSPPPIFRNYDEIGLIKKINYNLYKIDYVKVIVKENKIDNIIRV